MQTFLPYSSFTESAKVLDRQRLGKQRVEAFQIIRIVTAQDPDSRWRSHPTVKMWMGYDNLLKKYYNAIVREWLKRGYKQVILPQSFEVTTGPLIAKPEWLGLEAFHSSHRAALLAKNAEWYSQWGWIEKPEIKYLWPT